MSETIESTTKVGDIVKCVDNNGIQALTIGKLYTILKIEGSITLPICQIKNDIGRILNVFVRRFEKVDEVKSEENKMENTDTPFKVGDKVKAIARDAFYGIDGIDDILTVLEIQGNYVRLEKSGYRSACLYPMGDFVKYEKDAVPENKQELTQAKTLYKVHWQYRINPNTKVQYNGALEAFKGMRGVTTKFETTVKIDGVDVNMTEVVWDKRKGLLRSYIPTSQLKVINDEPKTKSRIHDSSGLDHLFTWMNKSKIR